MRAAVFLGPRRIEVADRPDPLVAAPTDAVVRVVLGCVCGSDLWYYRGESPHALGPIATTPMNSWRLGPAHAGTRRGSTRGLTHRRTQARPGRRRQSAPRPGDRAGRRPRCGGDQGRLQHAWLGILNIRRRRVLLVADVGAPGRAVAFVVDFDH